MEVRGAWRLRALPKAEERDDEAGQTEEGGWYIQGGTRYVESRAKGVVVPRF